MHRNSRVHLRHLISAVAASAAALSLAATVYLTRPAVANDAAACPIEPAANRTVVIFTKSGLAATSEAHAFTSGQAVNLEPGRYRISLVSSGVADDSEASDGEDQQWFLRLYRENNVHVYTTAATQDLDEEENTITETVAEDFRLEVPIVSVQGQHMLWPAQPNTAPNRVHALCAAFDRQDVPSSEAPAASPSPAVQPTPSPASSVTLAATPIPSITPDSSPSQAPPATLSPAPQPTVSNPPVPRRNNPPVLTVPETLSVRAGAVQGATITARDPDADEVTITLGSAMPSGSQRADFCQLID